MLPLLTERLSAGNFGMYIYTISVSAWISLAIDYGFNISATREIAKEKNNIMIKAIVLKTQSAKYILSLLSISIVPICYFFVPVFENHINWIFTAVLLGMLIGLMPQYYYQAIERLKLFGFIEVLSGIALYVLVYFFAIGHHTNDILMLCLVLTRVLPLLILSHLMFRNLNTSSVNFSFTSGLEQLKHCFSLFFFQLIVSLYTVFNMIFLGFFVSIVQVGIYGVSERLIRAGLGFIAQISNVIFPLLNKIKADGNVNLKRYRMMILCLFIIIGFSGCILVNLISPIAIPWIFNGKYDDSIELINFMAWVIPAIAISNVLSLQYFLIDGLESILNKVVSAASVVNLTLAYFMIQGYGYIGMAYTWVMIEWMISIILGVIIFCRSYSLRKLLFKID